MHKRRPSTPLARCHYAPESHRRIDDILYDKECRQWQERACCQADDIPETLYFQSFNQPIFGAGQCAPDTSGESSEADRYALLPLRPSTCHNSRLGQASPCRKQSLAGQECASPRAHLNGQRCSLSSPHAHIPRLTAALLPPTYAGGAPCRGYLALMPYPQAIVPDAAPSSPTERNVCAWVHQVQLANACVRSTLQEKSNGLQGVHVLFRPGMTCMT